MRKQKKRESIINNNKYHHSCWNRRSGGGVDACRRHGTTPVWRTRSKFQEWSRPCGVLSPLPLFPSHHLHRHHYFLLAVRIVRYFSNYKKLPQLSPSSSKIKTDEGCGGFCYERLAKKRRVVEGGVGHLEEGGLPWATLTTLNPCWLIPKVKSLFFFLLNLKILGFDFFFFFLVFINISWKNWEEFSAWKGVRLGKEGGRRNALAFLTGLLIFLNTSVGGSGPVWSLKRTGQIRTLYRCSTVAVITGPLCLGWGSNRPSILLPERLYLMILDGRIIK